MYTDLVSLHEMALSNESSLKLASDLAWILDHPDLAIDSEGRGWEVRGDVDQRRLAFNCFCALCLKCGIELPVLEPILYESLLPSGDNFRSLKGMESEQALWQKHVDRATQGVEGEDVFACNAMLFALSITSYNMSRAEMLARINYHLVKMGKDPIRPDYSKVPTHGAAIRKEGSFVKVLVFDDSKPDIAKTLRNIAGATGLALDFMHYTGGSADSTADKIIEREADLILLDEGLGDISGADLVGPLRKKNPKLVILGNTGGSGSEFRKVGVFTNCSKGEKLGPLREALMSLSR